MAQGPHLPAWLMFFSQVASSSQQPSNLDLPAAPELDWMEIGPSLTFIGHQDIPGVGNIHSGATPPWMIQDEYIAPGPVQAGCPLLAASGIMDAAGSPGMCVQCQVTNLPIQPPFWRYHPSSC
ncbi:hypothetical protein H8959_003211 [Pygathrix nigripes]